MVRTVLAQRLASASKPVLATVVNHAVVPSAVVARPRSTRRTTPATSRSTAAVDVVARDPDVAGEVVARTHGHDREHAVGLRREPGQRGHRAVAAARHHAAAAAERVAGPGREVGGAGGDHDLHVEAGDVADGGERVGHAGQALAGPAAAGRGIQQRGPGARQLGMGAHRGGA